MREASSGGVGGVEAPMSAVQCLGEGWCTRGRAAGQGEGLTVCRVVVVVIELVVVKTSTLTDRYVVEDWGGGGGGIAAECDH